jgi:PAS domain S-box-containing protein
MEEVNGLRRRVAELETVAATGERMARALRESEERYRSLVKQSSDGVYIFDPETAKILEANDEFTRMLKYDETEVGNLTVYDIAVLDREIIEANLQRVLQDGQFVVGLRQYRCKDGVLVDVEISSTLIHYGDARVVMVNMRDVTERIRAAKELEMQAAKLRDQAELLDVTEDAIIVRDMRDRITFWNQGATDRYGWTREEVLGKVVHRVLKTEFPRPLRRIRAELLRKGSVEVELIHTKRDGTPIFVGSKWALRRDKRSNPTAVLEINNDITGYKLAKESLEMANDALEARVRERTAELRDANERLTLELTRRKRIEDMLRKGAERYRNLFENSPIGIYRTNQEGRILMANPTLVRMMGYSSFDELASVKGEDGDYELTYLQGKIKEDLEKDGRVRGFEAKWTRADRSVIFVRENARAVRGPDGAVLYYEGTVEDITEGKKAEERVRLHQKQLRSLASELSLAEERERRRVATLLHDHLGQILAVSKIRLGALLESASGSRYIEDLQYIRGHIEQAIQFTRTLTFELSPPILYELGLESALEWLSEQVQQQHSIPIDLENDGDPKPMSEETSVFLFTAVRELLVNVVKHAAAEKVRVVIRKKGGNALISVEDDGVGFSASKLESYSVNTRGYGLFSIRERLRHLGGRVVVKSGKGRGTRVTLVAPLNSRNKKAR